MNFNSLGNHGGRGPPDNPFLPRQSSIYSLTLEELQSSMGGCGKEFGSMNMDELLKNIWSAEDTRALGSAAAAAGHLQRQGSIALPGTLSQKTVDEVWRDLSKEYGEVKDVGGFGGSNLPPRQQTLGEITLEEFLVKAKAVKEDDQLAGNNPNNSALLGDLSHIGNNPGLGIGFQQTAQSQPPPPQQQRRHQQPQPPPPPPQQLWPKQPTPAYGATMPTQSNLIQSGALHGGPVSRDGLGKSNGDFSFVSPLPYVFNGSLRGRKSASVEKVVERRQRRMIKNRESAARSRARKQAITTELEEEVAKLKEENKDLKKKQADLMEMQKNQVVEVMNTQKGIKRLRLRRMQTGPW